LQAPGGCLERLLRSSEQGRVGLALDHDLATGHGEVDAGVVSVSRLAPPAREFEKHPAAHNSARERFELRGCVPDGGDRLGSEEGTVRLSSFGSSRHKDVQ
jgi:hypothetical protein